MGQLGRPSVDEGSCHRVLGCLSGLRVREEPDKTGGFFAPSSSCFYAKDDEATSSAAHEFGVYVRSFLRRASVKAVPAYCPALRRGWPSLVRGETMVVSTASWAPPQMGRPFAITSMRRSSCLWMWSRFKSVSKVLVVTRAPASRHMRAAARSKGVLRFRRIPDCTHAARWSP